MMKHLLTALLLGAATTLPAAAQMQGNGYYRVENYITDRYAYLTDDKAKINTTATTVDVRAIELWKGFARASSDPATVLYMTENGTNNWNIQAQGANLYNMLGYYLHLRDAGATGVYYAYGTNSGGAKYLGDANANTADQSGTMSSEVSGDRRKWRIMPISAQNENNYFGILPTVSAQGHKYEPFYASFPFSAYSPGLKFWYVSKVEYGRAVMTPLAGTVAANTPVIVECSSSQPIDNRLNLGGNAQAPAGNKLAGVFYSRYDGPDAYHSNVTPYDPATMRLLGNAPDGSLAYITAQVDYIPRNQAYLKVTPGSPAVIPLMTQEAFDAFAATLPTGINISVTQATLYTGQTLALSATVTPASTSDASVSWTSSNTAVATVNQSGTVTAIASGSATVTATTVNGLTATCTINVHPVFPTAITVTPEQATIYANESIALTATLTPATVQRNEVYWESSDPATAFVNSTGLVTGVRTGTVTVTAITANGIKAASTINIRPNYPLEIRLSSTEIRLRRGSSQKLGCDVLPADARDRSVTWSSANPAIATVTQDGTVTGTGLGETTVSVTALNGVSAVCKVIVSNPLPSEITFEHGEGDVELTLDERRYITAIVLPADASPNRVTWTTSDAATVAVSTLGNQLCQIRGLALGTATITASTSNGVSASFNVTVVPKPIPVSAVTVTPATASLTEGEQIQLTAEISPSDATDRTLAWTSSNPSLATVDANGLVTTLQPGTVTITATAGTRSGLSTLTVYPKQAPVIEPTGIWLDHDIITLDKGETFQLTATVEPDDATETEVYWYTTDTEVATVNPYGQVTAVGGGTAQVSANTVNGLSASCQVTVMVAVERITLDIDHIEAIAGAQFTLTATVLPADATDKALSWISDNPTVATVNANGEITVKGIGIAVITVCATDGSGVEATCTVNGVTGIDSIIGDRGQADVYSPDGILLIKGADIDRISTLAPGLYIIGRHKVML